MFLIKPILFGTQHHLEKGVGKITQT